MTSKMRTSFTLTRGCDTGNQITTTIEYIMGMPDMLVIKQGSNKVEMTGPEANLFGYVLNEVDAYKRYTKRLDKAPSRDDDD